MGEGHTHSQTTRFRAFGAAELKGPEGNELVSILSRPKLVALLTYLAANTVRGFQRRDTLIGLLWAEADQDRARSALRQSLFHLRRALGDDVLVGRGDEEVGLLEARFSCDVAAFENALEAGDRREAVGLYRGDLLDGFYLPDAPEFERWLDERRTELRRRAASAAWHLAEQAATEGDAAAAADWSRRALSLAPLDEALLRRVLTLLDRLGDRSGVVREYEAFADRLSAQLELEPAPETQNLVRAIRSRGANDAGPRGATNGEASSPALVEAAEGGTDQRPRALGQVSRVRRPRAFRLGFVVGAGLVIAVGALLAFYGTGRDAELDPRRVVVAVFENRTGDPDLDPLGRMATDWLTEGLRQTGLVQVVPPEASLRVPLAPARGGGVDDPLVALAAATGAGKVVSGSVYLVGDSVQIDARVTDASQRRVMLSIQPVRGPRHDPTIAVEGLRQRLVGGFASLLDQRIGRQVDAVRQPPTYEAYKLFVKAQDLFDRGHNPGQGHYFDEAQRLFLRAVEIDSTLFGAYVRAAWCAANAGRPHEADSLARIANRQRDRLAPFSEARLDMLFAELRGDRLAALQAARKQMQTPLDPALRALWVNYPREAIGILEDAQEYATYLGSMGDEGIEQLYWQMLTSGYHLLGKYKRELKAARKARDRYPTSLSTLGMEARALAALGRLDQVTDLLDESLSITPEPGLNLLPPRTGFAPAMIFRIAAVELRGHGYTDAGLRASEREIKWYLSRPAEEISTPEGRAALAEAYYIGQRWDEAQSLYETLAKEFPSNIHHQGYLGVLAARRGDRTEAMRIAAGLTDLADPYDFGREAYWQACIASQLGDLERAMVLLREAYAQGKAYDLLPHVDPDLDPLRDYQPFKDFLQPKG